MWKYFIKSGKLYNHKEKHVGTGYSGWDDGDGVPEPGEGKNDPSKVSVRSVGPLPPGKWNIGPPFFHTTAGPYTMRLLPQKGTETHGRSGFLIHGDSGKDPGTASHGCIVLRRELRMLIWESYDHELEVLPGVDPDPK